MGSLANFDVRYPPSLPNDLEIVLYGPGLKPGDVAGTWFNSQWGQPTTTGGINTDSNSPAYGLDCVIIRYAGPSLPALVGQLMHFGVRLRIGVAPVHQEVWWTINGQRVHRPCDPHITWICTTTGWLVCVANPTTVPMYVYGCRFFPIGPTVRLPLLNQLNTDIQPEQFGAPAWTPLIPPGPRVFCIPPWCRIYFRVTVTRWRPIVFQLAARNVGEDILPLPTGAEGPNPQDWNGEQGTVVILTDRPTQDMPEDLNSDGAVGIPDFNMLRSAAGQVSEDAGQTQ